MPEGESITVNVKKASPKPAPATSDAPHIVRDNRKRLIKDSDEAKQSDASSKEVVVSEKKPIKPRADTELKPAASAPSQDKTDTNSNSKQEPEASSATAREVPETEDDNSPTTYNDRQAPKTVADYASHVETIDDHNARDYRISKSNLKRPPVGRSSHVFATSATFVVIVGAILAALYVVYPDVYSVFFE